MKSVYNQQEIAAICKVPVTTVEEWLSSGRIKSFEPVQGMGNRLAKADAVIEFLKQDGIPTDNLDERAKGNPA